MNNYTLTVLILTFRPGNELRHSLNALARQKKIPDRVLIINTEEKDFPEDIIEKYRGRFPVFSVFHISRKEFDHGKTRHLGMQFSSTDLVMNMTQDAVALDPYLTERLTDPFEDPCVAASYARQVAGKGAGVAERISRRFNYPPRSSVKSADDLERLGIKTFFCSDVCAVWRRESYFALGGFERKVIFNEDMIFAHKLIQNGYKIAYCADARVLHSHNYTGLKQLKRNFDLGVSQADHPEVFSAFPSEGEGIRLVRQSAGYMLRHALWAELFDLFRISGCKYCGYYLGKRYKKLPAGMIRFLTDNPSYWEGIL